MAKLGRQSQYALLIVAAMLWACKGGEKPADQPPARDLSLAPAESVAKINDRPMDQPAAQPQARPQPRPPAQQPRQPAAQPQPRPEPARVVETPTVGEGTSIDLAASDSLTSRSNKKGDAVTAVASAAISDARGRAVIPAGAVFSGTISDLATGGASSQGRMVLTFTRVSFGGKNYAVQARTDTLGTVMKGRGVTGAEAAKVGAGAVVGGIAGRLLGGNKKGTLIGAAAGTAGGVGVAAATRTTDIVLPAGALIRIVLTAPFELKEVAG
jgi:hypothetical protein